MNHQLKGNQQDAQTPSKQPASFTQGEQDKRQVEMSELSRKQRFFCSPPLNNSKNTPGANSSGPAGSGKRHHNLSRHPQSPNKQKQGRYFPFRENKTGITTSVSISSRGKDKRKSACVSL